MGTRCLTIVEDHKGSPLITMYRQFDGYPEGHGLELALFLRGFDIAGYHSDCDSKAKIANGMECLAAQVISHFKRPRRIAVGKLSNPAGNIYIYPNGSSDMGEEYTYRVIYSPENGGLVLSVQDMYANVQLFQDTPAQVVKQIRKKIRSNKVKVL